MKAYQKWFLIVFVVGILFLFALDTTGLYELNLQNRLAEINNNLINVKKTEKFDDYDYKSKCIKLYKKLRFPNQSLIMRPPPQKPPADMFQDFIQNGEMPITKYWYINEVYSDSNSNNKSVIVEVVSDQFNKWLKVVRERGLLNYGDAALNYIMHSDKYVSSIKGKTLAVIGTQEPWIEAIGYDIGASLVTTLDYTRKKYALPGLEWLHVNDYLDDVIQNEKLEHFDNIASFSSIEHSGLGRYGDPLSPYGDVEAVQQVHCMLKPEGLFFLALPTTSDNSSVIEFNAHRIYGTARLRLLFKGWKLLSRQSDTQGLHSIFVLKKINSEF